MYKAILFDLDGTLLPIDTDEFIRQYMKALALHMGNRVPPAKLVQQIMASTQKMIENVDSSLTNAQVFAADFFPAVGVEAASLMPVFDTFYAEKFPALKGTCPLLPGLAREVVQTAVVKGYEITLATNPLFPRAAIEERMRWIGIDDMPWRLITSYEEATACKPQIEYYREVLHKIGRAPEECLMVGNDLDEDGIAGALGMEVYIVTDYLINRSGRSLPKQSGTLAEFLKHLRDSPALCDPPHS